MTELRNLELLLSNTVDSILKEKFELNELRPQQKEVIGNLLSGRHTLAVLPTGYGKSLCYQLPSQLLPGITLVISPLISLMQDQINSLHRRGITNATFINSSLSEREMYERGQAIKNGTIKLLYVAPERFESEHFRSLIASREVSLLVIDEAHCVSHWGHDFRPQYRRMSRYLKQFSESTTFLALTATATNNVKHEIVDVLGIDRERCALVEGNLDRKNLTYKVVASKKVKDKEEILLSQLKRHKGAAIVYANSRKDCENLSYFLRRNEIKAGFYHAGMSSDSRTRTQTDFEESRLDTIVSTTAFGMGIDKADVRQVIHFSMPPSLESYYQESGRAGRDGDYSVCTLIFQKRDLAIQKWMLDKRYPTYDQILAVYNEIKDAPAGGLHWSELNDLGDINATLANRCVEHLRGLGYIDQVRGNFIALEFEDVEAVGFDTDDLALRRRMDEERLESVNDYAQGMACRRSRLIEYFDQRFAGLCSGCDICDNF